MKISGIINTHTHTSTTKIALPNTFRSKEQKKKFKIPKNISVSKPKEPNTLFTTGFTTGGCWLHFLPIFDYIYTNRIKISWLYNWYLYIWQTLTNYIWKIVLGKIEEFFERQKKNLIKTYCPTLWMRDKHFLSSYNPFS